jgi:aminoglycoside phosphotransferase (APT) family kinase protein
VESSTVEVLAHVNAVHAMSYRVVRRLAGGFQSGAYELRDADGGRAVLKWTTDTTWARQVLRAAPVVERVRTAGWPTAKWLAVGITPDGCPYQVQEYVDARPMGRLDARTIDLLIDLVERQRGLDPDPRRDWSQYVHDVVFDNRDEAREQARGIDAAAAGMVDRLMLACAEYRGYRLPTGDLVHGDLNPGNILVADGRIVSVVDIEALGSGTRAVDLVGLLASGYADSAPAPALASLRRAALAAAGWAGLTVCAAAGFFNLAVFLSRRNPSRLAAHYAHTTRMLDDLT